MGRIWGWGHYQQRLLRGSFQRDGLWVKQRFSFPDGRGSPPTSSTSSSSLTNDVAKQPVSRDLPPGRPGAAGPVGVQYTPHSHQFPRTRKMFDKGPDQVRMLTARALRALLGARLPPCPGFARPGSSQVAARGAFPFPVNSVSLHPAWRPLRGSVRDDGALLFPSTPSTPLRPRGSAPELTQTFREGEELAPCRGSEKP